MKAFDFVLVKFDEQFAYGDKEDVYKVIAKLSIDIPNLITASVGVAGIRKIHLYVTNIFTDYAEKENLDLCERYNIKKSDFPAYRLFNRDVNNPIIYTGEIKADAIKLFIVSNTGKFSELLTLTTN